MPEKNVWNYDDSSSFPELLFLPDGMKKKKKNELIRNKIKLPCTAGAFKIPVRSGMINIAQVPCSLMKRGFNKIFRRLIIFDIGYFSLSGF